MRQTTKNYLRALATLVGMIIGVGFFGVPYVVAQSGIGIGLSYFMVLGVVITLVHLMYGEVVLRTEDKHRFVGFVDKYLGIGWRRVAVTTSTLSFWSALLAYIIVGGKFLYFLFKNLGGSEFLYQVIFFFGLATFVYLGIRLVAKVETVLTALLVLVILVLIAMALPQSDLSRMPLWKPENFFLPYGVILFAITGGSAIPEIRDILVGRLRKRMSAIIIFGTALSILLTVLFALAVVGAVGESVSKDAVSSLAGVLGRWVLFVGALAGFLAVATSFLILGLNLKEQFQYDLQKGKWISWILALGVPFFLFLFLTRDFIQVIGFAGAVFTAFDAGLLAAVWIVARSRGEREPEYRLRIGGWLGWIIIALFTIGASYEIFF